MSRKIGGDILGRKLRTFRGTSDYFGDDARLRELVTGIITQTFQSFGFEPLETPCIENETTLTGKYGEEGEMRRFKLLLSGVSQAGLRYDHTVPLARFVAMYESELKKPYRRYAIGPVFRNESPAAGRLRQFTQCDFDTVGSSSPVVDAEVLAMINMVFTRLGFSESDYKIKLNDRRLLNALVAKAGFIDQEAINAVFRGWDKLEKASMVKIEDEVYETLVNLYTQASGESETKEQVISQKLSAFRSMTSTLQSLIGKSPEEVLSVLRTKFDSPQVQEACDQLERLVGYIKSMGVPEETFEINPLLARGLAYYTGPIFETIPNIKGSPGSIFGGGRFDTLIEDMGGPSIPASGASFGLDRIIDVMKRLGIVPPDLQKTQVFVTLFNLEDDSLVKKAFEVASELRNVGCNVEVYSGEKSRLGDQLSVANSKGIKMVIIIGPDELKEDTVLIKDMVSGDQFTVESTKLVERVEEYLAT